MPGIRLRVTCRRVAALALCPPVLRIAMSCGPLPQGRCRCDGAV
ncbi:hypothetical protein RSPO_c00997 [Ralstonia solanacearum Po82]|uniref:Uncharacterized protein n=1 Tax=Ralstonia solanacearum (strain Po82) TaxID=1031711 RepID=F6FZL1_RALS8|nr:hypothetical protein RSPO_c00997 [Ralstonia solanacearum Po82]